MEWRDEAFILSVRPHGETAAIVELLTKTQGRHLGLVRGARSKTQRGVLQAGNLVNAQWRARLADQLGNFKIELVRDRVAALLNDADRLAAVQAVCAMLSVGLAERESHPKLFDGLSALLDAINGDDLWPIGLVQFEIGMLAELGFGLDFSECGATGRKDDLVYVSPRTGRAICGEAGKPYHDRLLTLPPFLRPGANALPNEREIVDGLRLTGYFLNHELLGPHGARLPAARERLVERLKRAKTTPNHI